MIFVSIRMPYVFDRGCSRNVGSLVGEDDGLHLA